MHRDRVTGPSKGADMLDRRRIKDELSKPLDISPPSTSRNKVVPSTSVAKYAADRDNRASSALNTSKNKASDAEFETDSEESELSGSDGDGDTAWISWFCNLRGNEFFCEVDDDYILDAFNLCGLSSQVPYYDYALDLILDVETDHDDTFPGEQNELESAAEMLYGLIHVRYILTTKGMAAMLEKYKNYDFGRCPRPFCSGQPCLPVGQSDIPRSSTVKIFCPKCQDIYNPQSKYQAHIDGAYFGTTFPHLLLMTNAHLKPQKPNQSYVPKVFGFKINNKSSP